MLNLRVDFGPTMGADEKNFLYQLNFPYQDNQQPETLEQYLQWG
jgi:hypothetical protein